MRQIAGSFFLALLLAQTGCGDAGTESAPAAVLSGQVFLISKPGPIPIGWIPPPLESKCTIVVLNIDRIAVTNIPTDSKGKFSIQIAPGTYFLRVKESPIPVETGPYAVGAGETRTAEAHFDNGMR